MTGPAGRLGQSLFPALRPWWQQFWTGMLLGTIIGIPAMVAVVVILL